MCDHQADGGARNQDGVTTDRSSRDRSCVQSYRSTLRNSEKVSRRFDCDPNFVGNSRKAIRDSSCPREGRAGNADVLEVPLATRLAPSAISIAVPACPFSKWRGEGTVEIRMPRSGGHVSATTPPRPFPHFRRARFHRLISLARKIVDAYLRRSARERTIVK